MPWCEVGYFLISWGFLRPATVSGVCFQCCEGSECTVHEIPQHVEQSVQCFVDDDFKLVDGFAAMDTSACFEINGKTIGLKRSFTSVGDISCPEVLDRSLGKKTITRQMLFKTETEETNIVRAPQNKEKPDIICDVCEKSFALKKTVAQHLFQFHMNEDGSVRQLMKKPTCSCEECDEIFRSVSAGDQSMEKKIVSKSTKVLTECKECGKAFTSAFQLREHISIQHLKERNHKCNLCQQRFGRRGGLRRHIQMVHNNHVHKCPYEGCDHPGYKCSKALTAHIRSVHTNDRPFVCNECQKTFVRKNDLKMHSQVHSTDRTFECPCGARFRRQIYLRKHSKTCPLATTAVSISEGGSPASDALWPIKDGEKSGLLSLPLTPELRLSDEPLDLKPHSIPTASAIAVKSNEKSEQMLVDHDDDSETMVVVVD